ncbi:MAG: hypothetical protein JXN64_00960 [Spirochaetes bacterium]|nr:hypothetical protein [Spirochaetota bacterium]
MQPGTLNIIFQLLPGLCCLAIHPAKLAGTNIEEILKNKNNLFQFNFSKDLASKIPEV